MLIIACATCPGCGRPVDPTDDAVAVTPNETVRTTPASTYHRECIARLPDRERVVAKWRDHIVAAIRRRSDSTAVVGQGRGYAIVFDGEDDRIVLYYLNRMAEQRFDYTLRWRRFATLVKRFDPTDPVLSETGLAAVGSALAVRPDGHVVVSWVEPIRLEVDLAKRDYDAFVMRFGPLCGAVNFAELAVAGKLSPVQVEGSLEKNRGVVHDVRAIGEVVVVSLDASKRTEVPLAPAEFRELQRVVAGVKMLV